MKCVSRKEITYLYLVRNILNVVREMIKLLVLVIKKFYWYNYEEELYLTG